MSYLNLIENYSDYNREPLKIYFKAKQLLDSWHRGELHTKERWQLLGAIYQEIIDKYPDCKLTPFAYYLLARHYEGLIGSTMNYLPNYESAREKAAEYYREVTTKYGDAVFPICGYPKYFKVGLQIAPIAQMEIAQLYDVDGHVPRNTSRALKEYRKVIDNYPKAVDEEDYNLAVSAYVSILNIYTNWNGSTYGEEYVNYDEAKNTCDILLKGPNRKYLVQGWYFGETHPETLMKLAVMESDKNRAIGFYRRVISDYPTSWKGKAHSGGVGLYSVNALDEIIRLLNDPRLSINECERIIHSDTEDNIKGYAQYRMAYIYANEIKDYNKALIEYKKVLDNYGSITLDGEGWTLEDTVKEEIDKIKTEVR